MANLCTVSPVAWVAAGGTQAQWKAYDTTNPVPGMYKPYQWMSTVVGATSGSPTVFDADKWGIVCEAFATASDPTFGLSATVGAHSSSIAALQAQMVAVTPWAAASDAGGYMTTELHLELFGYVLGFLVIVWLADRVRRFFWREGGDHV